MSFLPIVLFIVLHDASAATWDCEQTNPTRPDYLQSVVLQARPSGLPTAVRVTQVATGATLIESRNLQSRPHYDQGYWFLTYGLDAWFVGDASDTRYQLLVPHGRLGAQFDIQVHEHFRAGGWWQNLFACVQR